MTPRALAKIIGPVRRAIEEHGMVRDGDRVLVAVSGGGDSVGLLVVLHHLRRRLGITPVAAHVHHGLRGADADADERCAAAAAKRLEVPFVRCSLGRRLSRGGNLEARARNLRYGALHELAAAHDCAKIATGHTRDDQAETVLLRLIRGSAPRGLGAIQPVRRDGVIRPLLDCRRADVAAAAAAAGLAFRHDASNDDPRFLRTEVRRRVLPLLGRLNPEIVAALARTAALQRAESAIVDAWVESVLPALGGRDGLRLGALAALPSAAGPFLLRRWLLERGIDAERLSSRHVEAALRLARSERPSGSVVLPGGVRVWRSGGELGVRVVPPAVPTVQRLRPGGEVRTGAGWRLRARLRRGRAGSSLPADLWSAVCDADEVPLPLTIRSARRGERVRPLGLNGTRKLSDVFVDRKVPRADRCSYPVVDGGGELIWVPGVVRAAVYRVGPTTKRSLWLHAERED